MYTRDPLKETPFCTATKFFLSTPFEIHEFASQLKIMTIDMAVTSVNKTMGNNDTSYPLTVLRPHQ